MSSDMSHGQGYRISPKLDSASPPADSLLRPHCQSESDYSPSSFGALALVLSKIESIDGRPAAAAAAPRLVASR